MSAGSGHLTPRRHGTEAVAPGGDELAGRRRAAPYDQQVMMELEGQAPDRNGGLANRAYPLLRFAPLGVVLLVAVFAWAMGWHHQLSLQALGDSRDLLHGWVDANPVLAPAAFFVFFAVAVAFAFPSSSLLTVFGGFLFGWLLSSVLVLFAATLGGCVLFLAARTAFADVLRRRFGSRAAALSEGFQRDAFGYLLLLRLAPVIPFWFVNIAPALFDVRLRTFAAATVIGILPGVLAYSWLGEGVDSMIDAALEAGREPRLADLLTPQIVVAFVLLALVVGIAVVVRSIRARRG